MRCPGSRPGISEAIRNVVSQPWPRIREPPVKKSVVIVDDDPVCCEALKMCFDNTQEFVVRAYTDPHEGWMSISGDPPDLAVLDVVMPVLGGQELAGMMHEKGITSEVVFLTGLLTQEETKARGYRVGNRNVVGKPVRFAVLLDLVRKVLQG